MSLADTAIADVKRILEDTEQGFARSITVTDPGGVADVLAGFTNDIGVVIDPDTGNAVTGRQAQASLSMASLMTAFGALPVGESDAAEKPWQMAFGGRTYRVLATAPDAGIDAIVCQLEDYDGP